MTDTNYDGLRLNHRTRNRRRRMRIAVGIVILILGYASLAVSPETRSQWVLFRAFAGFGLLFVGFGVAIVPLLSGLVGSDD